MLKNALLICALCLSSRVMAVGKYYCNSELGTATVHVAGNVVTISTPEQTIEGSATKVTKNDQVSYYLPYGVLGSFSLHVAHEDEIVLALGTGPNSTSREFYTCSKS